MSNKGRYCWIENDGKYKCDHLKQQLQQARQEAAKEIIQYIEDQGIIGCGWNYHQVYEIDRSNIVELKQRFGLEG